MAWPGPAQLAGRGLTGALRVSLAAVDVAAGSGAVAARLAVEAARAGAGAASAAGSAVITTKTALAGSTRIGYGAAVGGVRAAGRLLTGSDRGADGELQRLADATKAMVEPAQARRIRRVWTTRGRAHVELAAGILEAPAEVRRTLVHDIERLEGVEWAAVNDVVGRVLVAFDPLRISADKVVGAVAAFEQARGAELFAPRDEHPADLEPLVAAAVAVVVDAAAVGLAYAGKVLPVPALTRHATVVLSLLDGQPGIKRALSARFGTMGADLVFTGAGALLHAAAQSPTVPALYGVAAAARIVEVSSRRAVWQRREPQLCHPVSDDTATEPIESPVVRPVPLPAGPIEAYQSRLRRWSMGGALGVLAFTRRPTRSADWLKAVSPMAAVLGREVFAAVLDHLMCRRGVLPMDGSAYRRLDRVDAVVLDSDVLCSGPPLLLAATAHADGWDSSRVQAAAAHLLGLPDTQDFAAFDGDPTRLRLKRPEKSPGAPGARDRQLFDGDDLVGTVTIADRLDPLAETLLTAVATAGHRLVLTEHPAIAELAGIADEIAAADEPLVDTVRRLQADGHGVLAASAADRAGLIAADVGVAVPDPERPPAWGADLVTQSGLSDLWRLVAATTRARALSERAVGAARTGNVLGGLLASAGPPESGQRSATTPGKVATAVMMAIGVWSALQVNAEPLPSRTAHTPWQPAATAARWGRAGAEAVERQAGTASQALLDLLLDLRPGRARRRVWAGHGQAHIEVRGMTGRGPRHRRVAATVTRRLRRLDGVRWAQINAVTGQVLVSFDEGRVDVERLLSTVRKVEAAQGTREDDFSWSRPVHPADPAPVAAAAVELAADCIAAATALAGRFVPLPVVPRWLRAAHALVELERPLRRQLKRRIGPIGTDVVLTLSGAVLQGLSGGSGMPAVDALYRLELLGEALSRRAVWERRGEELCCAAATPPAEAPEQPPRPAARPKGPIEVWAEQLGPGALAAAGVALGLTRDPGRAAQMILVAVPKAARRGREGFATTVGRELARRGVVPLNAAAWRRFDRMTAIVLDAPVLCTHRPQVLAADPFAGVDPATIWREANVVLHGRSMDDLAGTGPWERGEVRLEPAEGEDGPGEPGAVRLRLRRGDEVLGRVTVGGELDPLADAVLEAARATGARVLLTRHAAVAELVSRVDEVLDGDVALEEHVRRLQADGQGVLVVSGTQDRALAAADVGVSVLGGEECVCWSSDLLCGPGLAPVWRILRAVGAARPVSVRAVQLAQAGSALGGLLALVGRRGNGGSHALAPVYGAALVALVAGTLAGAAATRQRLPAPVAHVPWHALDAVDVLARLDAARATSGLAEDDGWWTATTARMQRIGARVPGGHRIAAPTRAVMRFGAAVREELADPLTPVLAVGAAASAVVGSGIDALLVAAVMGGNALISGAQRVRAERALRRLFLQQEVAARRLQGSRRHDAAVETVAGLDDVPLESVPASELVPGDIVALRASDVVPADARLLAASDLEVDESTLTGESLPTEKDVRATPAVPLAERICMVYEGTTVLAGTGYAVVVATGEATEAGRATRAAGRAGAPAGIQTRLADVTRAALPATAIGGLAVTGLALLRRLPLRPAVAAGVSVAVAAVPEGLPLVATVAQATTARRLSRRGVLVRSSRTLEALGRVDVVCFDKTGTLTLGRLSVARLAAPDRDVDLDQPPARRLLTAAARACPAVDTEHIDTVPHATDRAVLEAAQAHAGHPEATAWRLLAELPFETSRGYAAAIGDADGESLLVVKGAPEAVLARCATAVRDDGGAHALTAARRRRVQQAVQRMAADGLRVLAVAERRHDLPTDADVERSATDLMLLGLIGVADTPRSDAAEAVRRIAGDGIRMIMVTGDHPTTATAIAKMVGMPADRVLTGDQLEEMPHDERVRRVAQTHVFARVSPEQKIRIVEALQAGGHVVAMTGDGTNDAAAIRLADVGIGVAAKESSAARSAADIVLADADIGHLHEALMEGRALWQRVRDAVSILVGGNAGEVAFMILGTALAGRAPIGVRQMLLVNMLTDMFPALAVAVADGRTGGDTDRCPATGFGGALARAVAIRGGATALGATLAWTIGRYTGRRRRAASMGLAALVGTQLAQTLLIGWRSPLVVVTTLASTAILVVVIEVPGLSQFFGCTPIGPLAWAVVAGSATVGTIAAALAPALIRSDAEKPAHRPAAAESTAA